MSLERKTPMRRTPMKRKATLTAETSDHLRTRVHWCIERKSNSRDPEVRFWAKVSEGLVSTLRPDLGPCLIHAGADNGHGYVQFTYNGSGDYAHRYAWERVHGPIPPDMTVDHLCEVKRCVNVDHFELATGVDNYLRTQLAKTECPNGHKYRPGSFHMRRGARECRICKQDTWQRGTRRRVRVANGLPDRRVSYDQGVVQAVIAEVRAATTTIAQGARVIGCNPNYLGKRVWRETRADVLARDGRCVRCGHEATDAHHRIARGKGGTSLPEIAFGMANLIALCRDCHGWVHNHPDHARPHGWMLYRSQTPAAEPVLFHDDVRRLLTVDGCYSTGPPTTRRETEPETDQPKEGERDD